MRLKINRFLFKTKANILLFSILILLLFVIIMGMLGLALDEQLMIIDPVNELSKSEVGEFYYYYNIKTLILVVLFIISSATMVVSFYKMVKRS